MLDWFKRKLGMQVPRKAPPDVEDVSPPRPSRLDATQLFRTYTGLLDDVMLRYSKDYAGEEFFNKIIAKNIFFGGGVYLNDGYLVNHPVARRYLAQEDSLLRVMMRTSNFVRILTRERDSEALARMPLRMANQGNESFKRLVDSNEWEHFGPLLKELATGLFFTNNARSWPNYDMSVGFRKLMERVLRSSPLALGLEHVTEDQLKWIADRFYGMGPEQGNPRDKFEKAVLQVLEDPHSAATCASMAIANQAYHYNFGLMLTAEEDNGVAVDTTVGMAFDELLATRRVERGQVDRIPLLNIPKDLPYDDGGIFAPFCDPNSKVSGAKLDYLRTLRDLLTTDARGIDDLRKDVREATKAYSHRIEQVFAEKYAGFRLDTDTADHWSFTQAMSHPKRWYQRSAATATASPNAWLTLTLQSRSKASQRRLLMDRFLITDATEDFSLKPERTVEVADVRPQIASLAFDEQKAEEFLLDIPRFT